MPLRALARDWFLSHLSRGPATNGHPLQRPWAGTGGKTLKDLGYGFLGQYRLHVKDHINRLLDLGHHTCVADPLEPFLVTTALLYGRHHKGMPRWPVIVGRIGILLAGPVRITHYPLAIFGPRGDAIGRVTLSDGHGSGECAKPPI